MVFGAPRIHHVANLLGSHPRECQVVTGRKAKHSAHATFSIGDQQTFFIHRLSRRIRQQRREIVLKCECGGILRILAAAGAWVPWAQIAFGIVRLWRRDRRPLYLPLPRAFRAVRRNENPFAGEWIQTTVRIYLPILHMGLCA